ncbi:MAG: DNA primase small subunit domain-containing protein [Nitrososphaerales archaeon]
MSDALSFDSNEPIKKGKYTSKYQNAEPDDKNKNWLEGIYRRYYFYHYSQLEVGELISEHEFGFKLFDGKIHRHLAFKDKKELYAYIIKFSPSDIFYSSSRYQNPKAEIDQKGWIGSDLIFDIDGKDLHLECAQSHNLVLCKDCSFISKGIISKCEGCNSTRLQIIDIPCTRCIHSLNVEVKKLIEILHDDFGIDKESIFIYFSGNNGYHIHIVDKNFYGVSAKKRNAFAQYLMGKGYLIENLGIRKNTEGVLFPVHNKVLYNQGWRKRIFDSMHLPIQNHRIDDKFIKKYNRMLVANSNNIQDIIGTHIVDLSAKIDPNVTMDIHRIFRLAGSINSKSGLIKAFCKDLDSFNPFVDACFIGDSNVEIESKLNIKISLKGKQFSIKTGKNTLPEYVAAYVICKGIGDIME